MTTDEFTEHLRQS